MSKRSRSTSRSPPLEPESRSRTPLSTSSTPVVELMQCTLPPHREPLSFASYEDYEVHYQQAHVNRCSQCSKNFPTGHFLNLHIGENHDPLAAARRARGEKTYGCFVEDCERKCSTPQKRRLHLIDKHMFPRSYNFYIINDGIDRHISLLKPLNSHRRRRSNVSISSSLEGRLRRRSSMSHPNPPEIPETRARAPQQKMPGDMDIDELEQFMSALRFVPASVARNRTKAHQKHP